MSFEQFCARLNARHYSQAELEQMLRNCLQQHRTDCADEAKARLDAQYTGWNQPSTRRGGSRATVVRFRGKEHEFESARAAYIWLIERFSEVNPSLFTDLRWETTGYVGVGRRRGPNGAARNYFARSPSKLFRQTPALAENQSNFRRMSNGWYVTSI